MHWMFLPYRRFFEFRGRSRRKEYWMWFLYNVIGVVVLMMLFGTRQATVGDGGFNVGAEATGFGGLLVNLFSLINLIPSIAVGVRRLHDTGRSGWWLLIGLVPLIGAIVLLIFFVKDGDNGANEYGPDPKNPATPEVFA